jgi:predicted Zn-dependent protease
MNWSSVLPLLLGLLSVLALARWRSSCRPAVQTVTMTCVAALIAVTWTFVATAIGVQYAIQHNDQLVAGLAWLPGLGFHHIDHSLGQIALISTAVSLVGLTRLAVRSIRSKPAHFDSPVVVLSDERPCAFAVPGRNGAVVVSTGMLDHLSGPERKVLFAHERAHLEKHHHVFTQVADICVALLPLLRPVARAIRSGIEMWSDDIATTHANDRKLVGQTIARAALVKHDFNTRIGYAMTDGDVTLRVKRMLEPEPTRKKALWNSAAITVAACVVISCVATQTNTLAAFLEHVATH